VTGNKPNGYLLPTFARIIAR